MFLKFNFYKTYEQPQEGNKQEDNNFNSGFTGFLKFIFMAVIMVVFNRNVLLTF